MYGHNQVAKIEPAPPVMGSPYRCIAQATTMPPRNPVSGLITPFVYKYNVEMPKIDTPAIIVRTTGASANSPAGTTISLATRSFVNHICGELSLIPLQ
jgi:hypothetical protein